MKKRKKPLTAEQIRKRQERWERFMRVQRKQIKRLERMFNLDGWKDK